MAEPIRTGGLREIIRRFSVLFVDIWGVLHDGAGAYPGAARALVEARRQGRKVVLITNSASAAADVAAKLDTLGIPRAAYDGIVSSGELGLKHMTGEAGNAPAAVFAIREGAGPAWLGRFASRLVTRLERAAVLLAVGMPCRTEAEVAESNLPDLLTRARALGLPMICADPDETYPENGRIRLGPGWLAARYREAGGEVIAFGKPHARIYAAAEAMAGGTRSDRVLAIGDNLATDIAGAAGRGYASLLVLGGGVHEAEGWEAVRARARAEGAVPTYLAERLTWQREARP